PSINCVINNLRTKYRNYTISPVRMGEFSHSLRTKQPFAHAAIADAETNGSRSVENLAVARFTPERPLKMGFRCKIQTSLSPRISSIIETPDINAFRY
ncbi:hypothetical protein, partial [Shimia abyssi]|uniref:hypothetical protein n=1 Tax=Shimia abyssi TaxID=1662395 RepID=UPI001A9CEE1E